MDEWDSEELLEMSRAFGRKTANHAGHRSAHHRAIRPMLQPPAAASSEPAKEGLSRLPLGSNPTDSLPRIGHPPRTVKRRRLYQSLEKTLVTPVSGQVLGVPLHADDEVAAGELDRLDEA